MLYKHPKKDFSCTKIQLMFHIFKLSEKAICYLMLFEYRNVNYKVLIEFTARKGFSQQIIFFLLFDIITFPPFCLFTGNSELDFKLNFNK